MADKNFKVKNGLTIEGTVNTLITADNSGGILIGGSPLATGTPKGDTASRPASPELGDIYSNTQTGYIEVYTAAGWSQLGVIPVVPTIGTATDVGTNVAYGVGSALVTFTPASTGGLASSYTVASTSGGYSATGSSSPIVVPNIPTGTSATFTVTATNGYGNSLATTASNSITTTSVPQVPTVGTPSNISGVAYGSPAQASLTFTAGATGGKSITNYKYSTDGTNYTTFSPPQTTSPLTIGGLTAGTTYAFRLKAINANGDSVATSASSSAKVYTVPQAPTIGAVSTNTSAVGQVNVAWSAPSNTGGDDISGYQITSSPGSITATASSSPYVMTGLTQGTNYTFTVKAANAAGYSAASSSSSSAAASRYNCSSGTISGNQCTYAATAYTGYTCPVASGHTIYAGCGNYPQYDIAVYAGCCNLVTTLPYSTVICVTAQPSRINSCDCGYNQPTCTTYTYYGCPSGGTLSGTSCISTPTVV
jgi:hypothetical protein